MLFYLQAFRLRRSPCADALGWRPTTRLIPVILTAVLAAQIYAAPFAISELGRNGTIFWSNAFTNGICTVEGASFPAGPWQPRINVFTTNGIGSTPLRVGLANGFYRLRNLDISAAPWGFSNLVSSYGTIRTIAGNGAGTVDGVNYWQSRFEGMPATNASLSRPHFAMADNNGNVYIVDKGSHSVLKVTPDGNIHTVAGNHQGADIGDGPAPATSLSLQFPNGEWVRGDGTIYILDTSNNKVRKVDTNGIMSTLFKAPDPINIGRGLWVNADESLVYFASGTDLKKWTPAAGVVTVNSHFQELGNIVADSQGRLFATDRGANYVYRLTSKGNLTMVAGNGSASGGGDGASALATGLLEVRGIWFLPNNGYLLATHAGSQVWYVDPAGIIHLFLDGAPGIHSGDGAYFHAPGLKISESRSVTLDNRGNILVTENDGGYVRFISFQRMSD